MVFETSGRVKTLRLAAFVAAVLGYTSACAQLLGIEEYTEQEPALVPGNTTDAAVAGAGTAGVPGTDGWETPQGGDETTGVGAANDTQGVGAMGPGNTTDAVGMAGLGGASGAAGIGGASATHGGGGTDPATECVNEEVLCDDGCVDPEYDPRYCGTSAECTGGTDCAKDEVCDAGQCRERDWQEAITLSDDLGEAIWVEVAVAPSGDDLVVWGESDGTRYNVWASFHRRGHWEEASLIESNPVSAVEGAVAFDEAGNAFVAWIQYEGVSDRVWAVRYAPETGWSSPEPLESDSTSHKRSLALTTGAAGRAVVAWHRFDQIEPLTGSEVWVAEHTSALAWGTAMAVPAWYAYVDETGPRLTPSRQGRLVLVWTSYNEGSNGSTARVYDPASGWSPTEEVADFINAGPPNLAVGAAISPSGEAFALTTEGSAIFAARYDESDGWINQGNINAPNAALYYATSPQLAFDHRGNGVAVWLQPDDSTKWDRVWATRYDSETGWGSPVRLDEEYEAPRGEPELAMIGETGDALVVWGRDVPQFVLCNRRRAGIWTGRQVLSDVAAITQQPTVAGGPTGAAVVAWLEEGPYGFEVRARALF